jgi:hypothetical protein
VAYKWTPPPGFSTLEHHGKTYYPGDMVPISKHDAEHSMRYTAHVFEGLDVETPGPAGIPAQQPATPKADER